MKKKKMSNLFRVRWIDDVTSVECCVRETRQAEDDDDDGKLSKGDQ